MKVFGRAVYRRDEKGGSMELIGGDAYEVPAEDWAIYCLSALSDLATGEKREAIMEVLEEMAREGCEAKPSAR